MAKGSAKATRKFAASGQLQKQIQARRKHQQIKKKSEKRKGGKGKERAHLGDAEDDGEEQGSAEEKQTSK